MSEGRERNNAPTNAESLGKTGAGPARDRLLVHALVDEVAPALTEGDDVSLEAVAAAAAAAAAAGAARLSADPTKGKGAATGTDDNPVAAQEDWAAGSSGGGGGGVARRQGADAGGGVDVGGEGVSGGGRQHDAAVAGLAAVGPLLAARVQGEAYGGVPAQQHAVDVRELEASAPVL